MTIDRRTWLKRTGAAALGLGVLRGAAACDDGDAARADTRSDDATGDGDGGGEDDATSTTPSDTGAAEVGPAALAPLRRDGSHPYDYIDHVVILQMENRSFDHYFGALKLVEGRQDVDGLTPDMQNLLGDGTAIPVFPAGPHWVVDPDPPHGRSAALGQWADGANSGFAAEYEARTGQAASLELKRQVMGYQVRAELPALYALADAFTVCDRWHCGLLGPTWPNRFYSHAATSDGIMANLTPLASKTIYSHALAAGLSYGVYYRSPVHFALTLQDPEPGSYPAQDIAQFFVDAAAGTLPNLTVVEPDYALDDDHPPHDIRLGQALIHSVYEALRQSPTWDRTVLLVFYDEHGGFFDHVPPPEPPGEPIAELRRMGFRIPGLIAGGLVRRGYVLKDLVEHSSVPGFIARIFGLDHVNERARLAGDFAAAFDLDMIVDARRPAPVALPPLEISRARLEAAFRMADTHQPELEAFARARYGVAVDRPDVQRAKTERYLASAERLGAVRLR